MLLEALLVLSAALPRAEDGAARLAATARARLAEQVRPTPSEPTPTPSFNPAARAVSNWRGQAGDWLLPGSLAFAARHAASEPAFVARCVRLNNYWCIKRAGWSGELGGDAEGHTGFATAADGADAAAQLLRRYTRDYGRRSALAIVRRWAPAECGAPRAVAGPRRAAVPAVSAALAPQGIGRTVRARFLARRAAGAGRPAGGLRVQPWSARARLAGHPGRAGGPAARTAPSAQRPVADILAGSSAAQGADRGPPRRPPPLAQSGAADPAALLAPGRLAAEAAALPSIAAGLPRGSLLDLSVPAPLCAGDETRIRNYAARIAGSVGLKPDDDLNLFTQDGAPTERLAPVLLAMSAVELGTLHASPALVAAAVARLTPVRTGAAE